MEHEDNAHLDNILQGSQNLMENLQMASGDSMCANLVDEIGGKFEEHEVHDDEEEWKYIKEGQQSEKQQQQRQMNAGIDCKDMEGIEEVGNGYGYSYEHGNVGADGMPLVDQHEVDNGVVGISAAADVDFMNSATGNDETEDVDIIKNDGDFSTTSNTTSTNGEDVGKDILQVEMKIEPAPVGQLVAQQSEDLSGKGLTEEDDEPSSLATNTTNGTNSLSENAPQQQQIEQVQIGGNLIEDLSIEDKENADPLMLNAVCSANNDAPERPHELDFEEMHSQLNPNATEFVPSFGSNPTSPIRPTSDVAKFLGDEPAFNNEVDKDIQPHPTAIPHHLRTDDDVIVAQSPRKGSGESNFDVIALPDQEIDFKHEAAKRPHELEQEDDLIGVTTAPHTEQEPQLHFEQYENQTAGVVNDDFIDYQRQSPSKLIDHGPETCVDLDADVDMQPIDNDKFASQQDEFSKNILNDSIVDVLNTVQILPIADEEIIPQETVVGKELLDVEEKENISNSPSTEEMQMNVQNELHSSTKDIPQIPIDMDNAAHMQESFYMESTSSGNQHNIGQVIDTDFEKLNIGMYEPSTEPDDMSFETMRAAEPSADQHEFADRLSAAPASFNSFNTEIMPAQEQIDVETCVITPSPISTEEKHLVEETKEQAPKSETLYDIEQKMDNLILSTKDEILSQVEEVAQTAANIVECMNPFSAPEPEQHETLEQMPIEADQLFSTESQPPQADFLQQNHEQFYHNEQKEQHQTPQQIAPEHLYEDHETEVSIIDLLEEPITPTKLKFELNGFESDAPATFNSEDTAPAVADQDEMATTTEPNFEPTIVAPSVELAVTPEPQQLLLSQPEKSTQQELLHLHETESQPVLELSRDIFANLSTADEPLVVANEATLSTTADATLAPVIDTTNASMNNELIAAAAGVGAIAATAAAVTVAATAAAAKDDKKPDIKKSRTPTATTKSKATDAKKSAEPIKKPLGGTTAKTAASASTTTAARPRTAPAKPTTIGDKKSTTSAVTKTSSTSTATATRKPLTSTAASTKTTTARPTTAPAAAKTATARTSSTTLPARRSAPTTTGGGAANGTAAHTKPKPIGAAAPTKPTTLGLSTTTKPKLLSPRTTLTSQLRKTAPTTTSTGTHLSTARSPLKTTAPTTNGISKSLANTTAASRAKSSNSATTTTTTTKTFTARPAPKMTHSSTLLSTTTRRTTTTTGSVSTSTSTTGTKTTTSTTLQKKTPLGNSTRLTITASGKSSLSPNKTTTSATLKVKTKDVPKKPITPTKTTNEQKAKPIKRPPHMNGTAGAGAGAGAGAAVAPGATDDLVNQATENKAQLNGTGDGAQLAQLANGIHHAELANGEGALLQQQQDMQAPALIDA